MRRFLMLLMEGILHQLRLVVHPITGFYRSQVGCLDFFHQRYFHVFSDSAKERGNGIPEDSSQ